MAKASKPASESKSRAPRTTRQVDAAPASDALDNKEAGATAPVSLSLDKAATGDTTDATNSSQPPAADGQPGDGAGPAEPPAAALVVGERVFFPGMGRFPPDWKPKPPPPPESESEGDEDEQTGAEEGADEAVQSSSWGLPDIAEFPAELTLVNNTRNILVVRPLNTRLLQFGEKIVQCPTAKQYDAIKREFAGRARRERWDSDKGLQVKHGED
ncbi:hypothetical protein [Pseudomonas sp. TWP3-2]|uniref:hypothetical protein n=1 Tax=Pseudomonas sp. TWP3-2 TaxID=2804574 RepID=UPI003CE839B7